MNHMWLEWSDGGPPEKPCPFCDAEQCPFPVGDDTLTSCVDVRTFLERVDDGVARTEAERRPLKVRRLLTSIDLTTMVDDDVSAVKETDDKPAVPTDEKNIVRALTIAGLCVKKLQGAIDVSNDKKLHMLTRTAFARISDAMVMTSGDDITDMINIFESRALKDNNID